MGALFPRCIASFGVTLPTYRGMAVLREQKDQRLSDLAAEISTLSRFVGKMKHKGLVPPAVGWKTRGGQSQLITHRRAGRLWKG